MEITKNITGELEATLIVKIEEQDYREKVDKELQNIRKKANIKGFRQGKTPLGIIEKMFGRDVKAQEVTRYLDEEVKKYFDENKVDIIGELLPSEKEETKFDIEKDKDFQFAFDFGFYPETKIELGELSVSEYKILVEENFIDEEIKTLQEKHGDFKEVELIVEKSQFRADFTEQKEDGLKIEDGLVLVSYLDEETKKQVLNAKVGTKFTIDVKKAFANETDLAALLKIEKDKLDTVSNIFEIEIKKIENYEKGELNQDFFDKLFGKDEVKSLEEMRSKLREIIEKQYDGESQMRFRIDFREALKNSVNINLPDEFLVKWQKNRRKTEDVEKIRKELTDTKTHIKWDRILSILSDEHNIKVEQEDLLESVKGNIINSIAQMGLSVSMFSDEQLDHFAEQELEKMKENDRYYLVFSTLERKVLDGLKDKVIKVQSEITFDELKSLYEKENKAETTVENE